MSLDPPISDFQRRVRRNRSLYMSSSGHADNYFTLTPYGAQQLLEHLEVYDVDLSQDPLIREQISP